MSEPSPNGVRVLSIDGGGFRALGGLLVVDAITTAAHRLSRPPDAPPLRPCQIFDLIAGSSTGAIPAVLLGRLGLDSKTAIQEYKKLTTALFPTNRTSFIDVLTTDGATLKPEPYNDALASLVARYSNGSKDIPFQLNLSNTTPAKSTKTLVYVKEKSASIASNVFSYKHSNHTLSPWLIPDLLHASTAAPPYLPHFPSPSSDPSYFDPAYHTLVSPTVLAKFEAEAEFKADVSALVSIGQGFAGLAVKGLRVGREPKDAVAQPFVRELFGAAYHKFGSDVVREKEALRIVKDVLQQSARIVDIEKDFKNIGAYARIDPPLGLDPWELVDAFDLSAVERSVSQWLASDAGKKQVEDIAAKLVVPLIPARVSVPDVPKNVKVNGSAVNGHGHGYITGTSVNGGYSYTHDESKTTESSGDSSSKETHIHTHTETSTSTSTTSKVDGEKKPPVVPPIHDLPIIVPVIPQVIGSTVSDSDITVDRVDVEVTTNGGYTHSHTHTESKSSEHTETKTEGHTGTGTAIVSPPKEIEIIAPPPPKPPIQLPEAKPEPPQTIIEVLPPPPKPSTAPPKKQPAPPPNPTVPKRENGAGALHANGNGHTIQTIEIDTSEVTHGSVVRDEEESARKEDIVEVRQSQTKPNPTPTLLPLPKKPELPIHVPVPNGNGNANGHAYGYGYGSALVNLPPLEFVFNQSSVETIVAEWLASEKGKNHIVDIVRALNVDVSHSAASVNGELERSRTEERERVKEETRTDVKVVVDGVNATDDYSGLELGKKSHVIVVIDDLTTIIRGQRWEEVRDALEIQADKDIDTVCLLHSTLNCDAIECTESEKDRDKEVVVVLRVVPARLLRTTSAPAAPATSTLVAIDRFNLLETVPIQALLTNKLSPSLRTLSFADSSTAATNAESESEFTVAPLLIPHVSLEQFCGRYGIDDADRGRLEKLGYVPGGSEIRELGREDWRDWVGFSPLGWKRILKKHDQFLKDVRLDLWSSAVAH